MTLIGVLPFLDLRQNEGVQIIDGNAAGLHKICSNPVKRWYGLKPLARSVHDRRRAGPDEFGTRTFENLNELGQVLFVLFGSMAYPDAAATCS